MFWLMLMMLQIAPPLSSVSLQGSVRDAQGAFMPRTYIFVRSSDSSGILGPPHELRTMHTETDRNGNYTLDLQPGFYDVCAFEDAYTPDCHKLHIEANHLANLDFLLKISPLAEKELGDPVY